MDSTSIIFNSFIKPAVKKNLSMSTVEERLANAEMFVNNKNDYVAAFKIYASLIESGDLDKPGRSTGSANYINDKNAFGMILNYCFAMEEDKDPAVMLTLGYAYLCGWGVPQDSKQARKYLEVAHEKGSAAASKLLVGM